jgi:uncharacterized membrane protein YjjB (DUF3815 family)
VFAALKVIATILLACASIAVAICESGHPLLFGVACAAFVVGIVGAEIFRVYRNRSVRSASLR